MIEYHTGDMFTSESRAFAHGVNTQGVMGAGIALTIAQKWPEVKRDYRLHCAQDGDYLLGSSLPVNTQDGWVVFNLFTQDLPGRHASAVRVDSALNEMYRQLRAMSLTRVSIPQIGCGIGGLRWDDVLPIIVKNATSRLNITTEIWTYSKEAAK